jgi:gamma-glutamylcyclotransferase (GGCT)/AIG2-like uncharacterized protein YtfP
MYAFVYGTLRKGDSRFGVLDGCECIIEEAYLDGYDMLNLGSFPGIIPGEGRIRGEIYQIDDVILSRLDSIEGYREDDPKHSLYIRTVVTPGDHLGVYGLEEDCITYVFNTEGRMQHHKKEDMIVESGDWFDVNPGRGRVHSAS